MKTAPSAHNYSLPADFGAGGTAIFAGCDTTRTVAAWSMYYDRSSVDTSGPVETDEVEYFINHKVYLGYPIVMRDAFVAALTDAGIRDAGHRVLASRIPIRA